MLIELKSNQPVHILLAESKGLKYKITLEMDLRLPMAKKSGCKYQNQVKTNL